MSTVGPLEGLTSGIGDELTDLAGLRSTRLTAALLPEQSVSTGVNSADYTQAFTSLLGTWTWDGTTTVLSTDTSQVLVDDYIRLDSDGQLFRVVSIVTNVSVVIANPDALTIPSGATGSSVVDPAVIILSSGTFALAVANGHRFRIQSGPLITLSALVDTRDSNVQVTLQTGLPTNLSGISWEIVIDPETTANVETTLDWAASGVIYIDGVKYTYASKTLTTLDGLEHFDQVDFVIGAKQEHRPQTEVLDFTQCFSALEIARKSLLVNLATGEDLSTVGSNIAVPRPPDLTDDDVYRALIKAVAYAPRGTIYAMELALTALFGPDGFEIFEDLTLGTVNHAATVFFRRTSNREEDPAGKTYLDGEEIRPLSSTTTVSLASAPVSPIMVGGVRLAPEPGPRLIDQGSDVNVKKISASPPTWVVEDLSGGFSTNIRPGDIVTITSGTFSGGFGTVSGSADESDPTTTELTVAALRGSPFEQLDIETSMIGVSYRVFRPVSNFRHYRPSEEVYVEYVGDPGTTQWTANALGGASELSDVAIADTSTSGRYLRLVDQVTAGTMTYSRPLRCFPSSRVVWEFYVSLPSATLSAAEADLNQITFILRDGEREIAVGFRDNGSGTTKFEFYDTAGPTAIGSGSGTLTSSPEEWATIRVIKDGRGPVRLFKNEQLISVVPYTSFASTTTRNMEWGALSTTVLQATFNPELRIKQMDWAVNEPLDLWNIQVTAGETLGGGFPERLKDAGLNGYFVIGDIGKRVRVKKVSTVDATTGSNALGEWVIVDVPTVNEIDVIGSTYGGAFFDAAFPSRIFIRGRHDAFIVPNNLPPHKIEIITGPNVGGYTIDQYLEVTGSPVKATATLTVSAASPVILNNEQFVLTDSLGRTKVFEFNVSLPFTPSPGAVTVPLSIGFLSTAVTHAQRIIDIINATTDLAITAKASGILGSSSWNNTNAVVILEQDTPGNAGNTVVTETVASGDFSATSFSGGVSERDPTKDAGGNPLLTLGLAAVPDTNPLEERLFIVDVTNPPTGGFVKSEEEDWRMIPKFPTDAGPVEFELVDAGSESAGVLTFREDLGTEFGMSSGELVAIGRTTVLSAQALDEPATVTEISPGPPRVLTRHAFWLFDDVGFARRVIDKLTVAGVISDFDSLVRDDAGPHLID